jgi:hypothetical protein
MSVDKAAGRGSVDKQANDEQDKLRREEIAAGLLTPFSSDIIFHVAMIELRFDLISWFLLGKQKLLEL